jgi:hypothetical protein
MPRTPFAIEQAALYFSTTTGGATPVAANAVGNFEGEPSVSITWASAQWRGQDRFAAHAVMHDADASATIPRFSFDSSEVAAKFIDGTNTAATTLHGGAAAATEVKIGKNSKPLMGEWLLEGTMANSGTLKVQVLFHKAYITGLSPTFGGNDFVATDLNLVLLQDASGDVMSVFHGA